MFHLHKKICLAKIGHLYNSGLGKHFEKSHTKCASFAITKNALQSVCTSCRTNSPGDTDFHESIDQTQGNTGEQGLLKGEGFACWLPSTVPAAQDVP